MPTFQSLGVGSNMDLSSLVTQLIAAERAPKQQQITKQQSQVAVQLSAVGTLKGAMSGFQTALTSLKLPTSFDVFTAKSGDETIFTASASESAPLGSYDVEVVRLAAAQQLSSDAFANGDARIGTGSLTLSVGSQSFTVEVAEDGASLKAIRDAINGADDNTGVRATIVNGTDGAHLVLTAEKTGLGSAMTVTASGGDGGLAIIAYSSGNPANYTEVRAAQDALISIAGTEHTSSSNTIKDAIEGVTLSLLKAQPDETVSLNVNRNIDTLVSRIGSFVAQYNSLAGTTASLQSYDATTKQAGALLGDPLVRSIESSLRREVGRPVEGASAEYSTLSSIGLTMKLDGKLEFDQTKLRAALESDFGAVERLFSGEDGVAARMDKLLAPHLSADGAIAQRNKSLDERTRRLQDDQVALEARMRVIEQRYTKQFTALDSLLAQLQSTSNYLTQQLANLPKIGE